MKKESSIINVYKALSNESSVRLFTSIANSNNGTQFSMTDFSLSKVQYYNKINDLRSAGLIFKLKGKYNVTSFGKVIFTLVKMLDKAAQEHWKLQAIDVMNSAKAMRIDKSKVIDILLDDIEIKEILLKELTNDYERSGSIVKHTQ
jgi:predicted transcriptional regulator